MGAWGYRPFENDSALDWIAGFDRQIEKTLHRYWRSRGRRQRGKTWYRGQEEVIAAIATILMCAPVHVPSLETIELATAAFYKLRADSEFSEQWVSPAHFRRQLQKLAPPLARELRRARRRRRALEAMFTGKRRRK